MNPGTTHNMAGFAVSGPANVQQNSSDAQNTQIKRFILHSLQQHPNGVAWRAQVTIQERIHWIKQMYGSRAPHHY
jgi:hypothetical protein